ncbi:NADPH-dependent FMN reductase [Lysinibacillus endophyticus]|uniref:NADPH-dependent FMN reductase n=1 Tax=Ureibacillus endophyticus TaxID=1978490 RepID=UPI003136D0ED
MKIVGISGTLVGSKTSLIVKKQLEELKEQRPSYEIEFIDLKDYTLDFCDGRPIDQYSDDTKKVIQLCEEADGFLIGTSILHGSMPGVLKNLFELVPIQAFTDKVVAFSASSGNPYHYLAIENYVKPVANYLGMYVLPAYFYSIPSDFNPQNEFVTPEKEQELKDFVASYDQFLRTLTQKNEVRT